MLSDAYFAAPYVALRVDNHGRYLRDRGDSDQGEGNGTEHIVPSSEGHWGKIGVLEVLFPGHARGSQMAAEVSGMFPHTVQSGYQCLSLFCAEYCLTLFRAPSNRLPHAAS